MSDRTPSPSSHCNQWPETLETYYRAWDPAMSPEDRRAQRDFGARFLGLLEKHPDCALRTCLPGHLTGAALVVTPDLGRVLLTHHRKLDRWLQLGGHADGQFDIASVAMREAEEESGLVDLRFLAWEAKLGAASCAPLFFDLDIHEIPARKDDPMHLHFDARYFVVTERPDSIAISDESHDLKWFTLEEARHLTGERSMQRMFEKLAWLREKLAATSL